MVTGVFLLFCCCLMGAFTAFGNVVLIGNNVTLSFEDIEANFAPSVKGSGISGTLHVAEPLDACSPLTNKIDSVKNDTKSPFVLIIRGGCSFDDKVRSAQAARFKAAIVYDSENGDLVAMAGNAAGIKIRAVFVSKASGETLTKYAGAAYVELWLMPSLENSAWSIMAISFISLLAMSAVLATCFFVRRHRIRRERPQAPRVREFHGMSSRLVKAMPSLIFTAVLEDNCTSQTCAICLEDYNVGEKLRILPCRHKFHATCVDAWLTSWRTFCPVCKRDARTSTGDPPPSESTPLLSSTPASFPSSSVLSSFRSSLASSPAIYIFINPPPIYPKLISSHLSLSLSIHPSSSSLLIFHQQLLWSSAVGIESSQPQPQRFGHMLVSSLQTHHPNAPTTTMQTPIPVLMNGGASLQRRACAGIVVAACFTIRAGVEYNIQFLIFENIL